MTELRKIDTTTLNRAARKIIDTNITMRKESTVMLADIRIAHNHFILKSANILDPSPRARGTTGQKTAGELIQERSTSDAT